MRIMSEQNLSSWANSSSSNIYQRDNYESLNESRPFYQRNNYRSTRNQIIILKEIIIIN